MINDEYFLNILIIQSKTAIFPETWYTIIDFCSWYSIFTNLQHRLSTLWLLLHLKSKTTSHHPINLVYSQMHGPCNSRSDRVNGHCNRVLIDFPNSCFFNADKCIHNTMLLINVTANVFRGNLRQKRMFFGFAPHIFVSFWTLYEYSYLV